MEKTFQFDPIVPFLFFENKKAEMLETMRRMKCVAGIRKFVLIFPMFNGELKSGDLAQEFGEFADLLLEIREALAPDHIEAGWWCSPSLSLLPQGSMEVEHLQKIVGIDGAESVGMGDGNGAAHCPLDRAFMAAYRICLQTVVKRARPPIIFMEDDFRMSHHDSAHYGCFCPLHIERFSRVTGITWTREQLDAAFRKGDRQAAQYRKAWAELMKETLVEFARELRSYVDEIAPDTRMALCQPYVSDFEGDMTGEVAQALAGNTRPLVRLFECDYGSDAAVNLPATSFHFFYGKRMLGDAIELIHESDPFPHTRFFFSATKLRALMTLAMFYGLDGSLSYITQYSDDPLEDQAYVTMIRESRAFFEALRGSAEGSDVAGPKLLYRPHAHVFRPIVGTFPDYSVCPAWVSVLGRFGVPYDVGIGEGPVLLCGEDVLDLSREEIVGLLARGAFIDGLAAYYLCADGYGDLLGAEVAAADEGTISSIVYDQLIEAHPWTDSFEGLTMNFAQKWGDIRNMIYRMNPGEACRILSVFKDGYGNAVGPASYLFTNRLGGRIAVLAYDLKINQYAAIYNYKRMKQTQRIIEWIGKENLPVCAAHDPNLFVSARENRETGDKLAVVINLCQDTLKQLTLETDRAWKMDVVYAMNDEGIWERIADAEWSPMANGKYKLTLPRECATLRPFALKFAN